MFLQLLLKKALKINENWWSEVLFVLVQIYKMDSILGTIKFQNWEAQG